MMLTSKKEAIFDEALATWRSSCRPAKCTHAFIGEMNVRTYVVECSKKIIKRKRKYVVERLAWQWLPIVIKRFKGDDRPGFFMF